MLAVPNLGNFSWTSCTHPNCSTDQKHINERRKIKDTKVGDDALAPPWNLKVSLFPTKRWDVAYYNYTIGGSFRHSTIVCTFQSSGTPQRPVKQRITQSTAASASTSSMAPPPQLASVPMLAAKQSVPLGEASSGTSRQLRPRVTRQLQRQPPLRCRHH
jgi:hypothetical protein